MFRVVLLFTVAIPFTFHAYSVSLVNHAEDENGFRDPQIYLNHAAIVEELRDKQGQRVDNTIRVAAGFEEAAQRADLEAALLRSKARDAVIRALKSLEEKPPQVISDIKSRSHNNQQRPLRFTDIYGVDPSIDMQTRLTHRNYDYAVTHAPDDAELQTHRPQMDDYLIPRDDESLEALRLLYIQKFLQKNGMLKTKEQYGSSFVPEKPAHNRFFEDDQVNQRRGPNKVAKLRVNSMTKRTNRPPTGKWPENVNFKDDLLLDRYFE